MSLIILNVDEVRRTLSASGGAFVAHDKEVDIVRFAINSGFADIVLDGQVALRVMYQRPGESQVRAQTLTYYDTDGLHNYYDWQLLSADLAEKGTLTVALCILRTDGDVEEWHTTPCQVRVLDTIHTDDSDEGDETTTPTVAQRVAVLETMIQRVASGAPIVVSSASAMTDTSQIYVLSTDGNWYYHNGTAWVAGGEYGAVATDTTLTQSGIPADAKAVGDVISIKSDIAFANTFPTWKYSFYYERSRVYNNLAIRQSRNAIHVDGTTAAGALRIPLVNNDAFSVRDYNIIVDTNPQFFQEMDWFIVGHTYRASVQLVSGTVTPIDSSQGAYLVAIKTVVDGSTTTIGSGVDFEFTCSDNKPQHIGLTIRAGDYSDALFLIEIEDVTAKYDTFFLKSKLDEITATSDNARILSLGNWEYQFPDTRSRKYVTEGGSNAVLTQYKNIFRIDGPITATLLRIPLLNNANFLVFSSKPTYAAYPQLFSPIDWFVVGHKYKILLYLISGSYTLVTPVSRPYFIELRYVQDGVATDIINNDDATFMCTNIPDYLGINFAKGTYSNASFLVQVVDITRLEQVDYAADFAKSVESDSVKKESMPIRHAMFDTSTQQVSFIFYSDIHSNPMGIDGVEGFIEKYGDYADDVLNGGDSARYDFDGDTANVNYLSSKLPSVSLTAIGNHDRAQMTDSGYNWQAHTSKEVYDKWIAPFVSGWDVVQPESASTEGYNYFYKDYKGIIRLIVLDCMCWDNVQLAWLESTLSDAKTEGLAVIVMTHWCNADFTGDRSCDWTDLDRTDSTDPQKDIFITDAACDAIDDFISGGGEFVCWLTGHLHRDRIGILTDYPNQLVYVANNAGIKTTGANDRGAFYSVTFITIDPTSKMLKLARYGCNYDAYLRPKHTLCYNYETKALVSQT